MIKANKNYQVYFFSKRSNDNEIVVHLTICIPETPKRVLWLTVKTQMKCRIMLLKLKQSSEKEFNFSQKLISCDPSIRDVYTMNHPKVIVSHLVEEPTGAY